MESLYRSAKDGNLAVVRTDPSKENGRRSWRSSIETAPLVLDVKGSVIGQGRAVQKPVARGNNEFGGRNVNIPRRGRIVNRVGDHLGLGLTVVWAPHQRHVPYRIPALFTASRDQGGEGKATGPTVWVLEPVKHRSKPRGLHHINPPKHKLQPKRMNFL